MNTTRGYAFRVYQEDDGTWAAEVPDLPGCVAGGDTPEHLFAMLEDAIDGWIEAAVADGDPVPEPSREPDYSGKFLVRIGRSLHRQLAHRAEVDGTSLNQYVAGALAAAVVSHRASSAPIHAPTGVSWLEVGHGWSIAAVGGVVHIGGVPPDPEPRRVSTDVINRVDVAAGIC